MKILNFRKCILTNKIKSKSELIRIVKTKKGEFFIDSNANGRGAYISKHVKNPDLVFKKRVLNRSFKTNVPKEIYDKLIKFLKGE